MKKFFSVLAAASLAMASVSAGSSDNYIQKWGRLKLNGKQLSSESGEAVQLRGWSSFGWQSNWGDCHQDGHLDQMKAWNANIYRGAMYVTEGGYNNDKTGFTNTTKHLIDYTAKIGMYYLCDWHVLTPGDPTSWDYNDAENYFRTISSYVKEKGYKHVLYEICNEPNGVSWDKIKEYADKILPIIQQNDPGACVVVGTPQWDQDIHLAQQNPISSSKYPQLNILYSFHYYACSHQQFLSRLENAAKAIPCFITEWGIADFSGGAGQRDVAASCYTSADALMNIANGSAGQKISWCAWSFGEKQEQASSLMSCGSMELAPTGKKIVELLGGDGSVVIPKSACYMNSCQAVPGVVDLGYYDQDPDAPNEDMGFGKVGSQYVGNGEGKLYHEENTVADEDNARSKCNGAFKWAGDDYTFRQDECVDASGCYGIANTEGWHNLGYIEPGEWVMLTVDVEEPGYYTLQGLCNPTTNQYIAIGDLTHMRNALVDMNTDEEFPGIAFVTEIKKFNGEDWNSWGWMDPVTDLDDQDDASNIAVLFKEAGKHQLKFSFMTGVEVESAGDMGPIKFTKAKAYSGPGYENGGASNVNEVSSDNSVVYSINGKNYVAIAGELTITNMMGATVATANVEAGAELPQLTNGAYIATIKSANAVKTAKVVIK